MQVVIEELGGWNPRLLHTTAADATSDGLDATGLGTPAVNWKDLRCEDAGILNWVDKGFP